MVEAIVRDEKKLIACSVSLDGEYGQKDICLGVPVILVKIGWEQILDYKLNDDEQDAVISLADRRAQAQAATTTAAALLLSVHLLLPYRRHAPNVD